MCRTTAVQRSLHLREAEQEDMEQISKRMLGKGNTPSKTEQVAEHMTSDVSVVSPDARLGEAIYLITAMHLRALAVYEGKRYIGFIAASQLIGARETLGARFQYVRVREFMNTIMMSPCSPWDFVRDVWRRMHKAGQSHLPVIDEDGRLAGVLSSVTRREQISTSLRSKGAPDTVLTLLKQDLSEESAMKSANIPWPRRSHN